MGKLKSESEMSAEWRRSNQAKVEAAVESVKRYYSDLISHWDEPGFASGEHDRWML